MDRYWDALIYGIPVAILGPEVYAIATGKTTLTKRSRQKLRLAREAAAAALDPSQESPPMRPRYVACGALVVFCLWLPLHLLTGRLNVIPARYLR